MKSVMDSRKENAARLQRLASPDVLVIGGGVNGVGTFRDLALNGRSVVMIERGDFAGGASSASTRMAHGGLRYLEGREFRLVAEATRERNLLLHHAPHLVRPLEIVVPVEGLARGLVSATARFLGLPSRSGPLSLAALEAGLLLYEFYGRAERALPRHRVFLRRNEFPAGLPATTCAVVSYFDGRIDTPEALIFEMLHEAQELPNAAALSHVDWEMKEPGVFEIADRLGAETWQVRPRLVLNAGGAWIDEINAKLGAPSRLVRKVKGAHLILRHDALHRRMAGRAFYFDDGTGRMAITLPLAETVLMGTTEVDTPDAGDRAVAGSEVAYLIGALRRLFGDLDIREDHVTAVTTGIRPLRAGGGASATKAARDHALVESRMPAPASLPVLSLVGGKWTTFRAFSEMAADRALSLLGAARTVSTVHRDYPGKPRKETGADGPSNPRLSTLLSRYGEIGRDVDAHCAAGEDHPLDTFTDYSRREIEWLVRRRAAMTLEDLVLRRTDMVLTGRLDLATLQELAEIQAQALGHDRAWSAAQVARCAADPRILGFRASQGQTA